MEVVVLYTDPYVRDNSQPIMQIYDISDINRNRLLSNEEIVNSALYRITPSKKITARQFRGVSLYIGQNVNPVLVFKREFLCGMDPMFTITKIYTDCNTWVYKIIVRVADVEVLQYVATNNLCFGSGIEKTQTQYYDPLRCLDFIIDSPISLMQTKTWNTNAAGYKFGEVMCKIEAKYRELIQQIEELKAENAKLAANQRIDTATIPICARITWKLSAEQYKAIISCLPAQLIAGEIAYE